MNTDKNTNKDNELKKDFKVAQYLYIAIYISLVIALIVISLWSMDLSVYIIGNLIFIALLYWIVRNKDS